jgi:putative tryptophan/tyrosine transport system substrate-binding protein
MALIVRRRFVVGLVGAAAWPLAGWAQQPGKIWRIGVLETTSEAQNAANIGAFRQAMRALGYTEGQNLAIEYRSADGRGERFEALAAELIALKVDVIVTRGTPAVLAAKNVAASLPVVMAAAGEPLMVVSSLARPGGNITGMSGYATDLEAKRAEIIKELVPSAVRIAGLHNMGNPITPGQWGEIQTAAQRLGIESQLLDVRRSEDIGPAFDAARRNRDGVLIVGIDALTQANRALIAELAAKYRMPAIYASREFVEAGGLIAYGPSYPDLYGRAAAYVDKILKGAKPSDLPVEQPTRFELVINLKATKALGLEVPLTLLIRADEVIE